MRFEQRYEELKQFVMRLRELLHSQRETEGE